jgi:hypothetical protein
MIGKLRQAGDEAESNSENAARQCSDNRPHFQILFSPTFPSISHHSLLFEWRISRDPNDRWSRVKTLHRPFFGRLIAKSQI